jgi:hypothetical protein
MKKKAHQKQAGVKKSIGLLLGINSGSNKRFLLMRGGWSANEFC